MSKKLKVAFDVGGVLSKYPDQFQTLFYILLESKGAEVFIISDMHPKEKIVDMVQRNGFDIDAAHVYSADYNAHGEACKAVLCKELGIDILVDDFIGYVADGDHIRLLVMPNSKRPYYHETWETDGSEGDFGRRKKSDESL